MRDTDLYSQILGITSPWSVALVELDTPKQTVTVHVRIDSATVLCCPRCGKPSPGYDHRVRQWRHLDTMQFQTILQADMPRVNCPEHSVLQVHAPWAEQGSGFTALFEALVIDWLKAASTATVARQLRLTWKAVDGIMQRAVKRGLARRARQAPEHISIDETSFQRRHEYVTVVTDQDTGTVLRVADKRTAESLQGFFEGLQQPQREAIRSISMDMWPAYITAVRQNVPNADERICFDKFHVAKYLGDAVDRVRRQEHRALSATGDERLKKTRYRWLENPDRMSLKHWREFEHLRNSALKTARAWAIKEHAMCLWHYQSRTWALKQWKHWLAWAQRSGLEPVRNVSATIRTYLWGIINAVVLKRTNAAAESMNSRIQRVKARACGFRNRERFRTAIMFHLGGLDLYPRPATTP
jgi:transposase